MYQIRTHSRYHKNNDIKILVKTVTIQFKRDNKKTGFNDSHMYD